MYSDNGKNFVGARNELEDLAKLMLSSEHQAHVINFMSRKEIGWHFWQRWQNEYLQ